MIPETGHSDFEMANSVDGTLTNEEIFKLFQELEDNESGFVTYENVRARLQSTLPGAPSHTNRFTRRFSRSTQAPNTTNLPVTGILNSCYPASRQRLSRQEFTRLVQSWNIPSQSTVNASSRISRNSTEPIPLLRRVKAAISLEAPQIIFMTFVVGLQLAFGIWQLVTFLNKEPARHALGWGVIVAKTFAGPIYPTIFLMILSMSRWLATISRKIPGLSRVVNWDLHRGFHIYMCSCCLVFATGHSIAHLSGDFVWGSRPQHRAAVEALWGMGWYDASYTKYISLLPGWSGIVALTIFWIIFGLSLPPVRTRCFEIFQLGHLLLYPLIGLLAAHGTLALLQKPLLGYFLFVPTVIVVLERLHRLVRGVLHMPAVARTLDKDTITLTIQRRWDGPWRCAPGQYILLQVPAISWWQWHPFTISSCNADLITVHVRNAGNWTSALRRVPRGASFCVSVDGPFGAPAQQFYQFDRAIVVGSGIGVTPMSSIANDVAIKMNRKKDPWKKLNCTVNDCGPFAKVYRPWLNRKCTTSDGMPSPLSSRGRHDDELRFFDLEKGNITDTICKHDDALACSSREVLGSTQRRRIDFHWITRDPPSLQWFSDYLNRAQDAAEVHSRGASGVSSAASSYADLKTLPRSPTLSTVSSRAPTTQLKFNINTYVTAANKTTSDHVFRYLVDAYRDPEQEYSILTGLKNNSHFRRPDFSLVLREYHKEMRTQGWDYGDVGVFYCGNPALGAALKEACRTQTAMAWADGSRMRYRFITEVF